MKLTSVLELIKELKKRISDINIWIYTGFKHEELIDLDDNIVNEILDNIDVLVDGPFVEDLKSDNCLFRGSTNQRIIYLK